MYLTVFAGLIRAHVYQKLHKDAVRRTGVKNRKSNGMSVMRCNAMRHENARKPRNRTLKAKSPGSSPGNATKSITYSRCAWLGTASDKKAIQQQALLVAAHPDTERVSFQLSRPPGVAWDITCASRSLASGNSTVSGSKSPGSSSRSSSCRGTRPYRRPNGVWGPGRRSPWR